MTDQTNTTIEAIDQPDGSVIVRGFGLDQTFDGADATNDALRHMHTIARDHVRRSVRVLTTGDSSDGSFIVEPDGVYYSEEAPAERLPIPTKAAPVNGGRGLLSDPGAPPVWDTPEAPAQPVELPVEPPATAPAASQMVAGPGQPRHHQRRSFIDVAPTVEPARQGWRGALNRVGFRLDPGPAEQEWRDDTASVQQHWPGPRTVGIVNPKGGAGKALEAHEPVLTPTGWVEIGSLRPGDQVIGRDGLPYDVLGVYPQGEQDLFRVALTDGTVIRATGDHLWEVQTAADRADGTCDVDGCDARPLARSLCSGHYDQCRRGAPLSPLRRGSYARVERNATGDRIMTTRELLEAGLWTARPGRGKRHNFFLPICQPIKFDPVALPLEPYALGLLLGDGGLSGFGLNFTTADSELLDGLQAALPSSVILRHQDRYDYRVARIAPSGRNEVISALRELGLWGHTSATKFVPDLYKFADLDARVALLQGLMDTDGSVGRRGTRAAFVSISSQLADDVQFLAETLGCVVSRGTYIPTYAYGGEARCGAVAHRLSIKPPAGLDLFRIQRKQSLMVAGQRPKPIRAITSITADGRGPAVCIEVASPDHLFLTRNCVPTHNTPASVLLSAIFARYGGAGVLAWDNNETRGTLAWRTERGAHDATVLDLLPEVSKLLSTAAQSAEMSYFAHHQRNDKYDVLQSDQSVEGDHEVSADDVDAIHRVASRFYRMVIMDSGNSERAANWRAMIGRTNALVVPCTNRADTAENGALMLEALRGRDDHSRQLAENAVVIVSNATGKKAEARCQAIAEGFRPIVREVVSIPYDPALVEGVIHFDALRPDTQRAWLRAAAAVAKGL